METLTEPGQLSGLDKLRAIDASRQPSGMDRLRQIDAESQRKIPAEDPSNFWNAIGVKPGQVSVETQHPNDLEHFARQFRTGESMVPGQSFDTIGENIRLQQNPELADRVGKEIARQKSLEPPEMSHMQAWHAAQNPNIEGGYRTDTGYDQQGLPVHSDISGKSPIVQPGEPGSQTMQQYRQGVPTAVSDIANIGFAGDMAGALVKPAVEAAVPAVEAGVKGLAKRVLKSGAQMAALNAPLSAIDEGFASPDHLQGAARGALHGAAGGFALGAGGHALLEGGMSGLQKLRAIDEATQRANPKILGTAAGAAAGAAGGYTGSDDGNKLENTLKGAAVGGALGYTYADRGGQIPGLTTERKSPDVPIFYSRLEAHLGSPKVAQQVGNKPKTIEWWDNFFKRGGDFAPKELKLRLGPILDAARKNPDVQISLDEMKGLLQKHPIKTQPNVMGAPIGGENEGLKRAQQEIEKFYQKHGTVPSSVIANPTGYDQEIVDKAQELYDQRTELLKIPEGPYKDMGRTSRHGYVEPGGGDQSEIAIEARGPFTTGKYSEPHYGENHEGIPDVVGHLRVTPRMIDGKKTLHVEEQQSQLGQDRAAHSKAHAALDAAKKSMGPDLSEPTVENLAAYRKAQAAVDALRDKHPPELPFTDDQSEYTNFLAKHVLDLAAREGADRVIWTPGEMQSERWASALRKKADRMVYNPETKSFKAIMGKNTVAEYRLEPGELPGMVGKDNADKLLGAPRKAWQGELVHQLKGGDFSVGSKGMVQSYDEAFPKALQKLANQNGTPITITHEPIESAAKRVPAEDVAIGTHASKRGFARNLSIELEDAMDDKRASISDPGYVTAAKLREIGNQAAIESLQNNMAAGEAVPAGRYSASLKTMEQARQAAVVEAIKALPPIERDKLSAFTGKDFWNIDDIAAPTEHEYADYTPEKLQHFIGEDSHDFPDEHEPNAIIAARIVLRNMRKEKLTFRDAVARLSPQSRDDLSGMLGENLFSPSHPTGSPYVKKAPVMPGFDRPASLGMKPFPLYSNPVGPALKNIYGNPLVGAAVGGGVGAIEDKDNRVRGALAGAGIGAVAGSLGAKGGSLKALRDLYEMPETKLAADLQAAFKDTRTNYRKSFVTPFAEIETKYPELTNALREDSRSYKLAQHTGLRKTDWVTEGLAAPQKEQFGKALVLDNMETEEARKLQAANDQQGQITQIRQSAAQFRTLEKQHESQAEALRKAGRHTEAEAEDQKAEHAHEQYRGALKQAGDIEENTHELRKAASNWKDRADALRPEVDPKTESEPWFQEALAKHKEFISPLEDRAATQAGVNARDFRKPRLAYVRLMSEERLRNTQIRSAQDLAARDPEAIQPRSGLIKTLVGEKLSRQRVMPLGATNPMEGPENPFMQGQRNITSRPSEGSSRTGSSKMASGTAEKYVTDYRTLVHQNALDKITRGSKNEVYSRLLDSGIGKVLESGDMVESGQDEITRVFKLPDGSLTVKRLQVPPEVAKALDKWEHDRKIQDYEGSRFRRMAGLFTRAQISGMPVEATSHANTVASIVASVPGEKDAKGKLLAAALPGIGAKAAAIREMSGINFHDPATRKLEARLADIGSLRIEDTSGGDRFNLLGIRNKESLQGYADERHGLISSAHHWLFGPEGIDVRGRLVLARKYLDRKPDATDKELAEFINGKLGNYNRASSGRAINALQDSQFSAFGRFQGARIPTGVKNIFGQSGLPANSTRQKLGDVARTLYRGPVGYGIGAQVANYAMTGHSTFQNEPGHHFDVQLGNPFTQKELGVGPDDRPVYAPFSTLNPVAATGMRATGATAMIDPKGYHASPLEVMAGPENTALGAASPMIRGVWSSLLGTAPYVEPDGTFLKTAKSKFSTQNAAKERLYQGLVHLNPAIGAFAGSGGDPGGRTLAGAISDGSRFGGPGAIAARAAEFLLPRMVNPGVGGRDNASSRDKVEGAKERAAMEQYTQDAKMQPSVEAFERLSDQAEQDMNDAGYSQDLINENLQKLERAWTNRDRSRDKSDARAERLGEKLRK